MKPSIKNSLAIFAPQGFLDGENAKSIVEPQDISFVRSKKCTAALISLKKVIFFNKRGLLTSIELLTKMKDKMGISIGFCDYDKKKYKNIMDMYENNVDFSLFETEQVASLFVGKPSKNPDEKVIVYNDDVDTKNQLAVELIERGFTPIVAKDKKQFETLKDDVEYIVNKSYVTSIERHIQAHIKDDTIVYSLPPFVDSEILEKFDLIYHDNTLKVGFKNFLFDASEVSSFNIHGVNFLAKLSTAGAEYGASLAICGLSEQKNITNTLKNDLEDSGILLYQQMQDFFDDESLSFESGGMINAESRNITKKLVSFLPLLVETSMHTVKIMTRLNIVKKSIKIQELSIPNKNTMLASAIAFYGMMNGFLLLVVDEEISKKACMLLLDDNEENDRNELINALGEFVNIIGGKIINEMQKKHQKVEMTMPRTYKTIEEVIKNKKGVKGAQIDFHVDGKPFTLFFTK